MHMKLADGKRVNRIFCGFLTCEGDLAKFIAEVSQELASQKGHPVLAELWEYETPPRIRKRLKVPTEAEELSATTVK